MKQREHKKSEGLYDESETGIGDTKAYDAVCKQILSERSILARIMKECVPEYKDCDIDEISNHYIENDPQISAVPVHRVSIIGLDTVEKAIEEGTVSFDILFSAKLPEQSGKVSLIINVEAQKDFYPGYPLVTRGIYYCSRLLSAQKNKVFFNDHYEKLQKVYSIWICLDPPLYRHNTIARYRIVEEDVVGHVGENTKNYDLLNTIMICLGDPSEVKCEGVLRMLSILLSEAVSVVEKIQVLEGEFGIPMADSFKEEVESMCNLGEGIYVKGRAEGRAEEQARAEERLIHRLTQNVKAVMRNYQVSARQAIDSLEIEEYREIILKRISEVQ